jgi:tetratricopeptide (TPR) repeat protein
MNASELSADAIEAALESLLSSAAFRGRPRLRRLLAYLVQQSLAGSADLLKEYALGVDVFDRGVRFDPLCDSIVRVEAFNLRKALRTYYRTEGATDLIRIDVPTRGYRATFTLKEEPPASILDDPERLCRQVEWSLLRGTSGEIARVRHHLHCAIGRWPERPDLHVALASTALAALELEAVSPEEGVDLMHHAAKAAMGLDVTRCDAPFYATIHEIRNPDKASSVAAAHRWLDAVPKSAVAHFWAGSALAASCKMGDALVYLQQAARLQPYATCFQTWVAVGLFCTGRPAAGLRHLRDILAFEPGDYLANYWLGLLAAHAGEYDEAHASATRACHISRGTQALAELGFIEAQWGHVEAAEQVLQSLADAGEKQYVARSGVCQVYVALGRMEDAARELSLARAEGDWELGWAGPDPRWNPLRGKVPGI